MPKGKAQRQSNYEPKTFRKKSFVNAYLLILAKKMLGYELAGIDKQPSILAIANFIYDRYKTSKYLHTTFLSPTEERDSVAASRAESLKKYVLTPKGYTLSLDKLDQIVTEIRILGRFSMWKKFASSFEHDSGAQIAESYLEQKQEIPRHIIQQLIALATFRILKLHLITQAIGAPLDFEQDAERKNYVRYYNDHVTRVANELELQEIFRMEENSTDFLTEYYILREDQLMQFPTIFITRNIFAQIKGLFFVVPIKANFYFKWLDDRFRSTKIDRNIINYQSNIFSAELHQRKNYFRVFLPAPDEQDIEILAKHFRLYFYRILYKTDTIFFVLAGDKTRAYFATKCGFKEKFGGRKSGDRYLELAGVDIYWEYPLFNNFYEDPTPEQ